VDVDAAEGVADREEERADHVGHRHAGEPTAASVQPALMPTFIQWLRTVASSVLVNCSTGIVNLDSCTLELPESVIDIKFSSCNMICFFVLCKKNRMDLLFARLLQWIMEVTTHVKL